MTIVKENHGTKVAVSPAYEWQPIETAPIGVKLQLKTKHGVAVYGHVSASNKGGYTDWAPLPFTRKANK